MWPGTTCESMINTILPYRQAFMRSVIMVRNHGKNTVISGINIVPLVCSFLKAKQLGNQSFLVTLDFK